MPLLGETIGANLRRVAAAHPDREALVDVPTGRRWTYARLDADTDALARGLIAAGHRGRATGSASGRRTAPSGCCSSTRPPRRGSSWSTSTRPTAASELGYAAAPVGRPAAGERGVVQDQRLPGDGRRRSGGGLARLERGRSTWASPEWDGARRGGRGRRRGEPDPLAEREAGLSFDDPINIQYTSGTTGFPKGATLSHHNILNNGFFIGEGCRYTEQDRVCIPVPFYHCFGMVLGNLACTTHGACIVIPAPGFEPAATLAAVQAERCTSLYGVPTMFIAELALPDFASYDLSTLRTGIMAGSPCPVEVMKRVVSEMHMTEVTICYGMTETSPVSTQTRADDDMERRVSTVGRVHPHVEVKIIDPETGLVAAARHRRGAVHPRVLGDARLLERRRSRRPSAIDAARWMHTGDLAVMDDGRVPEHRRAGSRTWSSAAGRTSTRARSRSSSTPTRRSRTSR